MLSIFTGIFSFFTSKFGAILLALALLGGIVYSIYHAGQDSEKADAAKTVQKAEAKAKADVDAANAKYNKIKDDQATWQAQLANAVENAKKGQANIVAGLQHYLRDAQNAHAIVKTIIKEVPKYVTQKADSDCTVTAGFVWLHDYSLQQTITVPGSGPADVDAASGIAISHVAEVDAFNNGECVERGKVISAWQTWYQKNKVLFDQVQEATK